MIFPKLIFLIFLSFSSSSSLIYKCNVVILMIIGIRFHALPWTKSRAVPTPFFLSWWAWMYKNVRERAQMSRESEWKRTHESVECFYAGECWTIVHPVALETSCQTLFVPAISPCLFFYNCFRHFSRLTDYKGKAGHGYAVVRRSRWLRVSDGFEDKRRRPGKLYFKEINNKTLSCSTHNWHNYGSGHRKKVASIA